MPSLAVETAIGIRVEILLGKIIETLSHQNFTPYGYSGDNVNEQIIQV